MKLYLDYRKHEDTDEPPDNPALRFVRRRFNATEDYRGTKLTVVENGKRMITPMLIVIIALGSTDLLFALDSIRRSTADPRAVPGVHRQRVRLMGLRQLYFLLGGCSEARLPVGWPVNHPGLHRRQADLARAALLPSADWAPWDGEIPIWVSLTVIVVTLTITTGQPGQVEYDQDRQATSDSEGEQSGRDRGVVRGRDRLDGQSD